jgi:hypothetical protein
LCNSTFGASKDKHNDLYDPLMANNVCVAGQLLLLDLIDKIEPYCELIQSNTDGLFLKVDNMETIQGIKFIASEWEKRTRLTLEWDIYGRIYQKDVNNYIIINENGEYKTKGAYLKKLTNIDYDLPIVNKGLIDYFVKNNPIEDTINECNDLREFQKIVKISSLYEYGMYGDQKLPEKVLRVFASKDENAQGVFKVKGTDKVEKVANTPERCFIYNESVLGINVPPDLDKQYYIDITKKRLSDFLTNRASKSAGKISSDIKYINKYTKQDILDFIEDSCHDNFVDFLVDLVEKVTINSKQIEILIKLNFFRQFGGNIKLLNIYKEFSEGDCRYSKKHKEETKKKRIPLLKIIEEQMPDEELPINEQLAFEKEMLGYAQSTYDYPKEYIYISALALGEYSPKVEGYCLSNGKKSPLKVKKKFYEKKPFSVGNILKVIKFSRKPKSVRTESGFQQLEGVYEWWIDYYEIAE